MTSTAHREAAEILIDTWSLHGRVVSHNYMYHREIFADVGKHLAARFGCTGISVCDLGCGDACHFSNALRELNVRSYRGCDLSETALTQARANVASLDPDTERLAPTWAIISGTAPSDSTWCFPASPCIT
ncbi:conserved domain protein [Methylococcus capsulatus str. Bath]|uniref:Conserved domain protein n=1 Tax=Methylococcus capsulatus (strain ATCC 33009 / NCIMB 11132 / Bath) TaxID=243233 RepID=Q604L5_METCA|nr:class I SAM-dependent methyltransferase [Methylococcus capsulatus]AAU91320.1 conserved domain protein [Methylococcus capsulatus str. Bath]